MHVSMYKKLLLSFDSTFVKRNLLTVLIIKLHLNSHWCGKEHCEEFN